MIGSGAFVNGTLVDMLLQGDAKLKTKTVYLNGTYRAADEPVQQGEDKYDGYSEFTCALPLITKSITENGTYVAADEPVAAGAPAVAGYSAVTVNVPSYEEEYREMLACQQRIAAQLGLTPPYDCDDISEAIEEESGYTFPEGTPIEDIVPVVEGDSVSDTTTCVSLKFGIFVSNSIAGDQYFWGLLSFNPEDLGLPETQRDYYGSGDWRMGIILSDGTLITKSVAGGGGLWKGDQWKMTVDGIDPTASTVTCTAYYYGNPNVYTTYDEYLQGYGATGNRFKVKNQRG